MFAKEWMKFVSDKCERGRGMRPRYGEIIKDYCTDNKGINVFQIFIWGGISLDIGQKFSFMARRVRSPKMGFQNVYPTI